MTTKEQVDENLSNNEAKQLFFKQILEEVESTLSEKKLAELEESEEITEDEEHAVSTVRILLKPIIMDETMYKVISLVRVT